jgi:hypothetical protein
MRVDRPGPSTTAHGCPVQPGGASNRKPRPNRARRPKCSILPSTGITPSNQKWGKYHRPGKMECTLGLFRANPPAFQRIENTLVEPTRIVKDKQHPL